jgi:hypothetical protein
MTSIEFYNNLYELINSRKEHIISQYKTRKIRKIDEMYIMFELQDRLMHTQKKTRTKRYRIDKDMYNEWEILNITDYTWSNLTIENVDLYSIINHKDSTVCHKILKVFASGELHISVYYVDKKEFDNVTNLIKEVRIV